MSLRNAWDKAKKLNERGEKVTDEGLEKLVDSRWSFVIVLVVALLIVAVLIGG